MVTLFRWDAGRRRGKRMKVRGPTERGRPPSRRVSSGSSETRSFPGEALFKDSKKSGTRYRYLIFLLWQQRDKILFSIGVNLYCKKNLKRFLSSFVRRFYRNSMLLINNIYYPETGNTCIALFFYKEKKCLF